MSNASSADALHVKRREHPFLYTWNRRLRHLHGISLRNLNINAPTSSVRGKTSTDDEYNLTTPAKSLARDDAHTLHHAKSYDQISRTQATNGGQQSSIHSPVKKEKTQKRPVRPAQGNMRRRSTLHWASSDPRTRQSKLEALEVDRLVTSWFSVHPAKLEEPIYISEIMEDSMNPSFSHFDLDSSIASVARSDNFVLRIWSKNEHMDEYRILVELDVNLRSLQFIGRSLETFQHPLPENCVLFHLSDGIYTSFTDLPAEVHQQPPLTPAMKSVAPTQGPTFDILLKLANLDDVIQDAIRTRSKLEADINSLLADMPQAENALSLLSSQQEDTKNAKRSCDNEHKSVDHSRRLKSELQASIQSSRDVVNSLPTIQSRALARQQRLQETAQKVRKEDDQVNESSNSQIRRICSSLMHIFPIEPVKNRALQFTIRNLHLPNSSFSDTNSDEIAAALGFAAQLVHQLSLYLSIPLPYPIRSSESSFFIQDDISAGLAQRHFPLHPVGAAYKFEYGVFLLNKDIEFLMNRSGLRAVDIRHTLPNLKYLIFVLTAGSGDLPTRKSGGIRGLLRVPDLSRRNSEESVISQASAALHDNKLAQQEKGGDLSDVFNGPLRAKGLPYHRSMLRDAG
ncbi:hypothetical protein LTS08_002816 [Lithohypha guttulata]|nr:hypothetical protein LTS08_002816 [Lithohypha guttulata]